MKHHTVIESFVMHVERIMNKINTYVFNMYLFTMFLFTMFLFSFKSTRKISVFKKENIIVYKRESIFKRPSHLRL